MMNIFRLRMEDDGQKRFRVKDACVCGILHVGVPCLDKSPMPYL